MANVLILFERLRGKKFSKPLNNVVDDKKIYLNVTKQVFCLKNVACVILTKEFPKKLNCF